MRNVLGVEALNDKEALGNLLDALSIAENAARQMAIYTDNGGWILVAEKLNATRSVCSAHAVTTLPHWLRT